jgi:hypothetical protein
VVEDIFPEAEVAEEVVQRAGEGGRVGAFVFLDVWDWGEG